MISFFSMPAKTSTAYHRSLVGRLSKIQLFFSQAGGAGILAGSYS